MDSLRILGKNYTKIERHTFAVDAATTQHKQNDTITTRSTVSRTLHKLTILNCQ